MNKYVEVKAEHCEMLNRAICRMLRPEHLRDNYVTDLYAAMFTHPVDGRMVLALPETQYVPVHIEASGDELKQVLDIFAKDGAITQAEAKAISDSVPMIAGTQVRVLDLIPPSWIDKVHTHEEMIEDGWFGTQDNI